MQSQFLVAEELKNITVFQETERLKNIIDNKGQKEIVSQLLSCTLVSLKNVKIENKSVFSYCLEKHPNIMRTAQKFMLKSFTDTITIKNFLPLHYAIDQVAKEKFFPTDEYLDPIYICLQMSANVNAFDDDGNTALHFYVKRILQLQNEFDNSRIKKEFIKNNDEDSILNIRPSVHPKILLLLLENDANAELKDCVQKTPLEYVSPPIARYIQLYLSNKKNKVVFFGKSIVWNSSNTPNTMSNNNSSYLDMNFPKHQFISSAPAVPLKQKIIDPDLAKQWVDKFTDSIEREEAQSLVNSIRYINFKEFLSGLQKTMASFNDYLIQQPETERHYILAIDGRANNSSPWVTALALRYLKFSPDKILDLNEIKRGNLDQNINHILFIDDASYSGNQLVDRSNFFLDLRVIVNDFFTTQLHIAIPYVTETTIKRLSLCGFIIHRYEIIAEISTKICSGCTLTYFQHKLAQPGISTASFLEKILPKIQPPYKIDPLILEKQDKSKMLSIKEQHSDKFIFDCFMRAEKEENFEPYERTYTYTDAILAVKVYLMQNNNVPDSQALFFKKNPSSAPEISVVELQEEKITPHGIENDF